MFKLLFLVILSGVIAYLGDKVGHKIGKRRLSIFGLRPYITANIITILTGIVITLVTLLLMTFLFKGVYIAIFEVETLLNSVDGFKKEVEVLKKTKTLFEENMKKREQEKEALSIEMNQLKKTKDELMVVLREMEEEKKRRLSGLLIFKADRPILSKIIEVQESPAKVLEELKELLSKTRDIASAKGVVAESFNVIWERVEKTFINLSNTIFEMQTDVVFGIIASENIFRGDRLSVQIKLIENKRIIEKDEHLITFEVSSGKTKEQIIGYLDYYLKKAGDIIFDKGRMEREAVVSTLQFYDYVNYLYSMKDKDLVIEVSAKDAIYCSGPFGLEISIFEKSDILTGVTTEAGETGK